MSASGRLRSTRISHDVSQRALATGATRDPAPQRGVRWATRTLFGSHHLTASVPMGSRKLRMRVRVNRRDRRPKQGFRPPIRGPGYTFEISGPGGVEYAAG